MGGDEGVLLMDPALASSPLDPYAEQLAFAAMWQPSAVQIT